MKTAHSTTARLQRSVVGAALLVLVLSGQVVAPANPARADAQCFDVRFIALRGSGEAGGVSGDAARGIYDAMHQYVLSGITTVLDAVDYPAAGMTWTGSAGADIAVNRRYQPSRDQGVANLDEYLDARQSCSKEKWVLVGFAQGAHVVGTALSADHGTLDAVQRSKVAAVVLLADPRFNPRETFAAGTFDVDRSGLLSRRPRGDLTRAAGKVRSWCDWGDVVCQGAGADSRRRVHRGSRYVRAHGDAVAAFVRERLGWPLTGGETGFTGPIDVAFVVDSTGSMRDDIERVADSAVEIVNRLGRGGADPRVGLVDYKDVDQGDPYAARVDLGFTSDATAFAAAMESLKVGGGGATDLPEAVLSGLNEALNRLEWRPGARRAVVLLGDAEGKNPEPVTGFTNESVIAQAVKKEIHIYPVVLPGTIESYFAELADGTGGKAFSVDDPTTIVEILRAAMTTVISVPTAALSPVSPTRPGRVVRFSAAASFDPRSEALTRFDWDFDGDGEPDTSTTRPFVNHTYQEPFRGTATVTAVNESKGTATGSTAVVVTRRDSIAPRLRPGPVRGLDVERHTSRLDVTWRRPSRGPVDGYILTLSRRRADEPSLVVVTTRRGDTLRKVQPGRYRLVVRAVNAVGPGAPASEPVRPRRR